MSRPTSILLSAHGLGAGSRPVACADMIVATDTVPVLPRLVGGRVFIRMDAVGGCVPCFDLRQVQP